MMSGMRFFIFGGVILMLTGLLQLLVRPRKPREHRWLNRGTVWAAFCIAIGLGAVLVGAGALPGPR
jgi:uncharacterized BrkB/YihY/UPF0761 family membrane protein